MLEPLPPEVEQFMRGLRGQSKTLDDLFLRYESLDRTYNSLKEEEASLLKKLEGEDLLSLEEKIEFAQERGFRWNSNNVRPRKETTVKRKVEQWHRDYFRGREFASQNILTLENFSQFNRALITGVCEALEESKGRQAPQNCSLRARFKSAIGVVD